MGAGSKPAYQYQSIVLAQGLKKLGFSIYSNVDYWRMDSVSNDYLFAHDPAISPSDCSIVFVPCQWLAYGQEFPIAELKGAVHSIKVLIDVCDGLFTMAFQASARIFDVILKQKTSGIAYPDNCLHPWVFGLSEELSEATSGAPDFNHRRKSIAVNFRHKHSIRELFKDRVARELGGVYQIDTSHDSLQSSYRALSGGAFKDQEDLLYRQSGGRHGRNYLDRLKNSMCSAAFGGTFMIGGNMENHRLIHAFASYAIKGRAGGKIAKLLEKLSLQIDHTYNVYQWDSWRYWESIACGCVTFHLDFERYGVQLPVMPNNWEHYVGFDLLQPRECIERFLSLTTGDLEKIGLNGRDWAISNYTPEPMARRLLRYLGMEV